MDRVRAVLFDVFGTVVDWRGSLIEALGGFGASRGITADWAGLTDAWRGAYKPSMDRVRHGDLPWPDLDALHRASLAQLLPEFGLHALPAADLDHLTQFWHRLRPWPDSPAGLARLRQRLPIATLSNGNVALLVDLARAGGLVWDMVFGADLFRHYKPDPETYLGACALLGLPPGAVMLAAAHPSDLAAARALGLRTCFIPRAHEYGPAQAAEQATPGSVDLICGIGELADRLD